MANTTQILNRAQNVVEYLLSLVFIVSAIELIGQGALTNTGPLSQIFGGQIAMYFYMAWFFFVGFSLLYAKVKKKKKLHKHMLLAIYLTTIYTSILTVGVLGFAWTQIIDDVIIGVLAATFWLRWKFRTEYIDPHAFQKTAERYRDDLP